MSEENPAPTGAKSVGVRGASLGGGAALGYMIIWVMQNTIAWEMTEVVEYSVVTLSIGFVQWVARRF